MLRHRFGHFLLTISQAVSYFIPFLLIPIRFYLRCFLSIINANRQDAKEVHRVFLSSSKFLHSLCNDIVYTALRVIWQFADAAPFIKIFFPMLLFISALLHHAPNLSLNHERAVDKSINNFYSKSRVRGSF